MNRATRLPWAARLRKGGALVLVSETVFKGCFSNEALCQPESPVEGRVQRHRGAVESGRVGQIGQIGRVECSSCHEVAIEVSVRQMYCAGIGYILDQPTRRKHASGRSPADPVTS